MSKASKGTFIGRITDVLKEQIQKAVFSGLRRGLMKTLRLIVIAVMGAIVMAAGVVFIWLGVYHYLSAFLQPWIAWLLMGFTSILIGLILLLVAYLSR